MQLEVEYIVTLLNKIVARAGTLRCYGNSSICTSSLYIDVSLLVNAPKIYSHYNLSKYAIQPDLVRKYGRFLYQYLFPL
jgi:hypothetical protein